MKISKIIAGIILAVIVTFIVIVTILSQDNIKVNIGWVVLSFMLQFGFCMFFLLCAFLPISLDKKDMNQKAFAIFTNLIFLLSTTMLITVNTFFYEWWFQTISFLTSFLLLLFICRRIKKEKEIDLSSLRISNYFMVIFISGIVTLLKEHSYNESIQEFMHYYLSPLLMLQGLYQLLDRKNEKITKRYLTKFRKKKIYGILSKDFWW